MPLCFDMASRTHQAKICQGSLPLSAWFASIQGVGVNSGMILVVAKPMEKLDIKRKTNGNMEMPS